MQTVVPTPRKGTSAVNRPSKFDSMDMEEAMAIDLVAEDLSDGVESMVIVMRL